MLVLRLAHSRLRRTEVRCLGNSMRAQKPPRGASLFSEPLLRHISRVQRETIEQSNAREQLYLNSLSFAL